MRALRVTKYDPANRDPDGAYLPDDWTSICDIGREFLGAVLSQEEYETVEGAYVSTAISFLKESGASELQVRGLENRTGCDLSFTEGSWLGLERLAEVFRDVLRELWWARFEDDSGRYVHFGYDYYMYVGTPEQCPVAEDRAATHGLFCEPFRSPLEPDDS